VIISRHWHGKHISAQRYTETTVEDTVLFAAIARQRHGKLVFTAANQCATLEDPLKIMFSLQPVPRLQQPVNLCFADQQWQFVVNHIISIVNGCHLRMTEDYRIANRRMYVCVCVPARTVVIIILLSFFGPLRYVTIGYGNSQ
jgi:hypothetical protein